MPNHFTFTLILFIHIHFHLRISFEQQQQQAIATQSYYLRIHLKTGFDYRESSALEIVKYNYVLFCYVLLSQFVVCFHGSQFWIKTTGCVQFCWNKKYEQNKLMNHFERWSQRFIFSMKTDCMHQYIITIQIQLIWTSVHFKVRYTFASI